ncbi:hypothetical protein [Candidatus Enterovibrio altilux]|uniref:Uncharacterized protein n=1 Tax=Candidatus Enterovibrio altilux TaxID=1927128 RepID=A0A291BAS7_9GAMM|nr:hypothetical protein [Candidatus Enterovibrio luxaltus]ATF10097.1 hypothetical protein BTN50_1661 [Candidatus Enterovibrio luxaltus]
MLVLIDPKKNKFALHIMYQAYIKSKRKFYYVMLYNEEIGKWTPCVGGYERNYLTRIEAAFKHEFTKNPRTDYYKFQEHKELEKTFKKTKNIMEEIKANRIHAELARWSNVESLYSKKQWV